MKNERVSLNTFSVACLLSALCRTGLLDEVGQISESTFFYAMFIVIF